MIVLPGGPGTENYMKSEKLLEKLKEFSINRKLGAICAAPTILSALGILNGKQAICFPACEPDLIKDGAHAYFYHKQIVDLASPLIPEHEMIVKDKSYIRIYGLERKLGKWTGKENLERYLKDQDFETWMYIYVKDVLSDDEYVDIIKLIIASIYSEHDEYNITLKVRKDDNFKDTDGTIGSQIFFQDMNQHPNLTPEHFTTERILWGISGQRFYNSH